MGVLCQLVCVLRVLLNTQKGRALKGLWGKLTVQPSLALKHMAGISAIPQLFLTSWQQLPVHIHAMGCCFPVLTRKGIWIPQN